MKSPNKSSLLLFAVAVNPGMYDASSDFENMFRVFNQSSKTFINENRHLTKVISENAGGAQSHTAPESDLSSALIVEFKLRGLLKTPLNYGDLSNVVQNGRLFDEALFRLIQQPEFALFESSTVALARHEELRRFLQRHQTLDLFSQKHGYWWRYILEGNFSGIENIDDAFFQAWVEFGFYIQTTFPDRVASYLTMRGKLTPFDSLSESVAKLDQSFLNELLRFYPKRRYKKMFSIIEGSITDRVSEVNQVRIQSQKLDVYLGLAAYFNKKGEYFWSGEAELKWIDLSRRLALYPSNQRVFEIAELLLRAKRYKEARSLVGSLKKQDLQEEEAGQYYYLIARSYEGQAAMLGDPQGQQSFLEWSAEYYRQALNILLMSEHRDELLKAYARVLGRLQLPEARMSVLQTLFRGGSVRENQIEGLIAYIYENISKASDESDPEEKRKALQKALSLLEQFARANPQDDSLKDLVTQAEKIKLQFKGKVDPRITASLFQVQNILKQRAVRDTKQHKSHKLRLKKESL